MSLREKIQESKDIVKQTMNQVKEMAKEIISAAAKAFRQQIVDNVLDGERKKEYIGWIIEQINKYDTIRLNRYLTKQKPPYFIDVDTTSNIKNKSFGEKLKKKVTEKVTGTLKKAKETVYGVKTTFNTTNEYMKEIHNRVIKVIDNLLEKEYVQYSIETAFLKTMNRMPFRYETKQYQFDEMLKDDFIDGKTNTIKKSFQVSLLNNRCGKNKTAKKPKKIKGGVKGKLLSKNISQKNLQKGPLKGKVEGQKSVDIKNQGSSSLENLSNMGSTMGSAMGSAGSLTLRTMIKPITFIVRKELEKWLKRAMNHGLCEVIETMMKHPNVVQALEVKTRSFISNISLNVSLDRALVLFNPKFNFTRKKMGGQKRNKTAKKRMSYRGGRMSYRGGRMSYRGGRMSYRGGLKIQNYRLGKGAAMSSLNDFKNQKTKNIKESYNLEERKKFYDINNPESVTKNIMKNRQDHHKNEKIKIMDDNQIKEHMTKMTEFMKSLEDRIQEKSKSFSEILESDSLVKVFHTGLDRYYIEKVFDKHILRKTFLEYLRKTGRQIIINNPRLKPTIEKILNGTHKTDCDVSEIRLTKDPNPLTDEEINEISLLQNKASLVNPLAPLTAAFSSVLASLRPKPKSTRDQTTGTPQSKGKIQKIQEQIDHEIGDSFYDQNIRDKYEKHVNHAARRSIGESIYR